MVVHFNYALKLRLCKGLKVQYERLGGVNSHVAVLYCSRTYIDMLLA